jgi:hypothetical protein
MPLPLMSSFVVGLSLSVLLLAALFPILVSLIVAACVLRFILGVPKSDPSLEPHCEEKKKDADDAFRAGFNRGFKLDD